MAEWARQTVWIAGDILTASALNGEFNNIINLGTFDFTYSGTQTFNAGTLKIKGGSSGIVTLTNTNTTNSRTYTFLDFGADSDIMSTNALQQGLHNITFAQGADSSQIKITGANGASLGAGNNGVVRIRSSTAGTWRTFTVTADVTIDLTGAHWGNDGNGNLTGALLRVYAIDDNGTLRWGVGYQGGFYYIRNTQDDTTAANINLPEEILTSTNVTTDNSPMRDVGWVKADFTDATNEWAITEYHPGESADGLGQPYNPTFTGFSANPSTPNLRFYQIGKAVYLNWNSNSGTSNSASYTFTGPFKAASSNYYNTVIVLDNGGLQASPGFISTTSGSQTLTLGKALTGAGGFTASAGKASVGSLIYEAYQP